MVGSSLVRDVFLVPRSLVYAVLVATVAAFPATVWGGAWYLSQQRSDAQHTQDALRAFEADVYKRRDADDRSAAVTAASIQELHDRLTHIEAQLEFLVRTGGPKP